MGVDAQVASLQVEFRLSSFHFCEQDVKEGEEVKCVRCGYCFRTMCIVVVDKPAWGIKEDNFKVVAPKEGPCPHLRGNEPGGFSCAVHDRSWYSETPCADYGQIERSPDTPCRTGTYMMKQWREKKLIFPPLAKETFNETELYRPENA